MSNPPNTNVPASEPAVQGYSLSDDQFPGGTATGATGNDPTAVPLPKSPEVAEPHTQSIAAATGPGSSTYDGPNPFLGPSDGTSGAAVHAQDAPPSPSARPGETVLSYSPPQHEQDYAPPPGPPPPASSGAPAFPTPNQPAAPAAGGDDALYANNTQLASLHAIFPDFDAETLQSVLESVGGDQDRAVDTLLGMSDPEHVSTSGPETQAHPQQKSQTELDEEFARHLMLQEQEEYNQAQEQARSAQGERWTPRQRSSQEQVPGTGAGANAGERDTLAEVQEQVTKLAESGKRTFSSLLTKAKAKFQEFDQSRTQGQGQGQQGSSSFGGPTQAQQPQQPPAPWATGGSWNSGAPPQPAPGLDRHQQAAAYAPVAPPATVPAPSTTPNMAPGHDFASGAATPPPPRTSSGAPNPGTSPPRALNPSEVGLLPKRPVTLQTAQSGSVGGRGGMAPPDDDDAEELEYVENPFEERRR